MKCPSCEGSKVMRGFVMRSDGCNFGELPCHTCRGTGAVSDDHAERLSRGQALREDRVRRGISLREEAKRRGISVVGLSDLEHGR